MSAYTLKTKGTPGKIELPSNVWSMEDQTNLLATAAFEAVKAYFGDGSKDKKENPSIRDQLTEKEQIMYDPIFRALHANVVEMDVFMAGRYSSFTT